VDTELDIGGRAGLRRSPQPYERKEENSYGCNESLRLCDTVPPQMQGNDPETYNNTKSVEKQRPPTSNKAFRRLFGLQHLLEFVPIISLRGVSWRYIPITLKMPRRGF